MIAFIDTEVGVDSQRVWDYGAVREDGAVMHTQSAQEFNTFVSKCDVLCGHNIIKHDLKYLNLQRRHVIIDTLPLSPLLFSKKPYHRLLKDDKLQVDELNNPVNDARRLAICSPTRWLHGGNCQLVSKGFFNVCSPEHRSLKDSWSTLLRQRYHRNIRNRVWRR